MGVEPNCVKCAVISGLVFIFNGLAAVLAGSGVFGLMTMRINVRGEKFEIEITSSIDVVMHAKWCVIGAHRVKSNFRVFDPPAGGFLSTAA